MDGPRAATLRELPLVESLANHVFRAYEAAPQTMFQEYPDLYDADNIENIRIVSEDGRPVSNINYLPQTILIEGCDVPAATLGGVATLPQYRGRGYSTLLLENCVRQMERQGVCVLHVSGDRHMYRSAGCFPAGQIFEYELSAPNWPQPQVRLEEAGEERLDVICRLYNQESVRYRRTYDRMGMLMKSRKYINHAATDRHTLVVKQDGVDEAYLALLTENGAGRVVEWAGNKRLILASAGLVMKRYGLATLRGGILPRDESALAFLRDMGVRATVGRLSGTIKIIRFVGFMEALRPYFKERYPSKFVDNLRFSCGVDGIGFEYLGMKCTVAEKAHWNDLIFGGGETENDRFICAEGIDLFRDFFASVFPVPMVDTGNLSCV